MTDADDPILSIEKLRVTFDTVEGPVDAVRGVSFALRRGRTLAVVGESGSGKSVTSYAILRLIQRPGRITGGRIVFRPPGAAPVDITLLPQRSPDLYRLRGGQIAMIFQEPMTALSPVHSIGDQLCEAIRLHQTADRHEARELACDALARVGMTEPRRRLDQYPFEFSGGMRQRVVIAMALACRPQVLIADEPTTALDVTLQAQFLKLLGQLRAETGMSVIFVTHDLGVVAQVADDVVVMSNGLVVEAGPVRDVFRRPYHPYTKRLLLAVPRFDDEGFDAERIRTAACDEIPPGMTLAPPDDDFRTDDRASSLYELTGGRKLLLWTEPEAANQ